MPADEHDAWVKSVFGVDPASYVGRGGASVATPPVPEMALAHGASADGPVAAAGGPGGNSATPAKQNTTATKAPVPNAKAAADAVTLLKTHRAKDVIAIEIADLDKRLADAGHLADEGQGAAAWRVNQDVIQRAARLTQIADQSGRYADALTVAETRASACTVAVTALAPPPAAIAKALQDMQDQTITAAKAKGATRDFGAAVELLKAAEPRCLALDNLVAQHKAFATALTAANDAVAKLVQPVVAAEAKRIAAERVEPAKTKAAAGDYDAALALLAKANAECAAAAKLAAGADEAQKARGAAQRALDKGRHDLPAAIDAVQKLLDPLLAHPQAAAIKELTDSIAATIAHAKIQPPPADAASKLTAAADLCVTARVTAEQAASYAPALAAAEAAVAALTDGVVGPDKAKIQKERIDAAKAFVAAKAPDYAHAMPLLDTAMTECAAAAEIQTKDRAFQTALQAAQAALDALGAIKPTPDPTIGAEAQKIQTDSIDAAKALIAPSARNYDEANKRLASVATDCDALGLKKKMSGTTLPDKAAFATLMKEPGGTAKLDTMIKGLPDNTNTKVVQTAIEARFGLKSFQNLTKTGTAAGAGVSDAKSLKKIYELMTKVPPSHAQDNPSFQNLEVHGGSALDQENKDRGSFYSETDKKIVLSCGRVNDPRVGTTPLQKLTELPTVEPDCQAVPDSAAPPPTYFDWTTLHEVGHAIDDKKGFMNSKAGASAFGGWQYHGPDVMPVAKAIASSTNLTGPDAEKYLAAYLQKSNPRRPPAPPGRADWATALAAAEAWCNAIRVGTNLWNSDSASSAHKASDGRVYHEAYDNGFWVSYEFAARSKGITGYQFRAPGEWLAELYAAYHSKKLKDSHPAAGWLATL